jgi:hypothetical protein
MPDTGAGGHAPDPDEIDRRLRELTEEVGKSRIHEPSALERLAAAKQAQKRAERKRGSRMLAVGAVIVVLAGGGAFAWLRIHPPSWLSRAAVRSTPSVRVIPKISPARPSFSPSTVNGPPADPFANSPADGWANGAAGITIPAARPHGPYTSGQVAAAYAQTRTILIAANLDPATLHGGKPNALANLLISQQRKDFLGGLNKIGLDSHGYPVSTRTWVTSFAPGTSFLTNVVKTRGTLSARISTLSGVRALSVEVNYIFVYAVKSSRDASDWLRVVEHIYGTIDFAAWDDPGGRLEPWFNLTGSIAGVMCSTDDGYVHPDFPNGPPSSIAPSGPPVNPYSTATPTPEPSNSSSNNYNCQRATGT